MINKDEMDKLIRGLRRARAAAFKEEREVGDWDAANCARAEAVTYTDAIRSILDAIRASRKEG